MPEQALKYAVLHHSGIDEPHFDLLFETEPGSDLACFRLGSWPPEDAASATKLRNHRRMYLTYQGEIFGGRGMVIRVAEGLAQWVAAEGLLVCDGGMVIRLEQVMDEEYRVGRE